MEISEIEDGKSLADWQRKKDFLDRLENDINGVIGANMAIATSVVLGMTCGPKARDIIFGKKPDKK